MKRLVYLVLVIVACLAVTAQAGVTTVYPVGNTFSGSSNGIALTSAIGNALNGDTTVVSVTAPQSVKVARVDFKPQANITGTINVKLGSTTVYAIVNAQANNVYGMNLLPSYVVGAAGDDLIINAPASADVYYNIHYIKQ